MTHSNSIVTLVVIAALLVVRSSSGQNPSGQNPSAQASAPSAAVRGDAYLLTTGKNYNKHAYDHARILKHYASTGEPVPSDVVMEHTTGMRAGMTAAAKTYGKLSSAVTNDSDAGRQIAEMQDRLKMLDEKIARLQAVCAQQQQVEARQVTELTTQVAQALRANGLANSQAYQAVAPSAGASWYTDGSFDE
jgi:hypothetical protein